MERTPLPPRSRRGISAAVLAALAMLIALLLASSAQANAHTPSPVNGTWTGRTSQGLRVTVQVRHHRVASVQLDLKGTPESGFPASACTPLNESESEPIRTVRAPHFAFAGDGDDISGAFTGARRLTGHISQDPLGSRWPCMGSATFTATPTKR